MYIPHSIDPKSSIEGVYAHIEIPSCVKGAYATGRRPVVIPACCAVGLEQRQTVLREQHRGCRVVGMLVSVITAVRLRIPNTLIEIRLLFQV